MNIDTIANGSHLGSSNKWVFYGQTRNKTIHNESQGGKTIELLNPTQIVGTVSAGRYRLPRDLELIHAYHPDHKKLMDFNLSMSRLAMQGNTSYKAKLLIRQKGLCELCGNTLLDERGEFNFDGSSHIHHLKPRALKGAKGLLKNMALVHAQCHQEHHLG